MTPAAPRRWRKPDQALRAGMTIAATGGGARFGASRVAAAARFSARSTTFSGGRTPIAGEYPGSAEGAILAAAARMRVEANDRRTPETSNVTRRPRRGGPPTGRAPGAGPVSQPAEGLSRCLPGDWEADGYRHRDRIGRISHTHVPPAAPIAPGDRCVTSLRLLPSGRQRERSGHEPSCVWRPRGVRRRPSDGGCRGVGFR